MNYYNKDTIIYHLKFNVKYEYPVLFVDNIFTVPKYLRQVFEFGTKDDPKPFKCIVYIDRGVSDNNSDLIYNLEVFFKTNKDLVNLITKPYLLEGGEKIKDGPKTLENIIYELKTNKMCRHSFVLCFGGGSVLDIVGFASSLVHRGIRIIRFPTTVLAQGDAGVGVKNGIDKYGIKNFLGTFAPPYAVINDFSFLKTLPLKYWTGGFSESFKVAIIKDRKFFEFLKNHADGIRNRDLKIAKKIIKNTAILHLEHIRTSGDPFEKDSARPLDFGHWIAHYLETLSGYRLSHGEAVGIGIAVDTCYAYNTGFLTKDERDQILNTMEKAGFVLTDPLIYKKDACGIPVILEGLEQFREHLGGKLSITLPCHIGKKIEIDSIDTNLLIKSIEFIRKKYGNKM